MYHSLLLVALAMAQGPGADVQQRERAQQPPAGQGAEAVYRDFEPSEKISLDAPIDFPRDI